VFFSTFPDIMDRLFLQQVFVIDLDYKEHRVTFLVSANESQRLVSENVGDAESDDHVCRHRGEVGEIVEEVEGIHIGRVKDVRLTDGGVGKVVTALGGGENVMLFRKNKSGVFFEVVLAVVSPRTNR